MGVRLFLGKRADFEGARITSDAGGLLLRELGHRDRLKGNLGENSYTGRIISCK